MIFSEELFSGIAISSEAKYAVISLTFGHKIIIYIDWLLSTTFWNASSSFLISPFLFSSFLYLRPYFFLYGIYYYKILLLPLLVLPAPLLHYWFACLSSGCIFLRTQNSQGSSQPLKYHSMLSAQVPLFTLHPTGIWEMCTFFPLTLNSLTLKVTTVCIFLCMAAGYLMILQYLRLPLSVFFYFYQIRYRKCNSHFALSLTSSLYVFFQLKTSAFWSPLMGV